MKKHLLVAFQCELARRVDALPENVVRPRLPRAEKIARAPDESGRRDRQQCDHHENLDQGECSTALHA